MTPDAFIEGLRSRGVDFFTGVPDSLLRNACDYLQAKYPDDNLIAANEGNAVAIAAGHYLATGKPAAVYLQNSGLGNAVNPITSLISKDVYSIPALIIVGWRGEPGIKDEPQHMVQGAITPQLLELMGLPHHVIDADCELDSVLDQAHAQLASGVPVALLVRKGAFADYENPLSEKGFELVREAFLGELLDVIDQRALIVATTGVTSRELFELREARGEAHAEFLNVGAMGHASSVALGVALGRPDRQVVCIDGDGAALMHLGAMAIIGDQRPGNLIHVLLNNAAHESVGGQPTVLDDTDLEAVALGCGYSGYSQIREAGELAATWKAISQLPGPQLVEVQIAVEARTDLGRPTLTPRQTRDLFMDHARD